MLQFLTTLFFTTQFQEQIRTKMARLAKSALTSAKKVPRRTLEWSVYATNSSDLDK